MCWGVDTCVSGGAGVVVRRKVHVRSRQSLNYPFPVETRMSGQAARLIRSPPRTRSRTRPGPAAEGVVFGKTGSATKQCHQRSGVGVDSSRTCLPHPVGCGPADPVYTISCVLSVAELTSNGSSAPQAAAWTRLAHVVPHLPARSCPACCARPGGRARAGRTGGRRWSLCAVAARVGCVVSCPIQLASGDFSFWLRAPCHV
jgi:hypothetical protein